MSAELHQVDQPVSLLCGDQDCTFPLANSEELARRLPNSSLRVILGVGHDVTFDAADDLASAIDAHVRAAGKSE